MGRIVLDVSDEEHRPIKALAALKGQTVKDYVLERVLKRNGDNVGDKAVLAELEALLEARVARFEREGPAKETVEEILQSVCARKGLTPEHG